MSLKFFRSRTVWTIVVLFVINGFEGAPKMRDAISKAKSEDEIIRVLEQIET